MDESDTELAVDVVFRSAHGLETAMNLCGGRINPETMSAVAAAIIMAKQELESRGWKWQPEKAPTVVQVGKLPT